MKSIDKELKRLRRADLLEMMVAQSRQIDELTKQLEEANRKLESRQIILDRAGSIAEASMQLNGVFEAAQKAADDYLENIHRAYLEIMQKKQKMEENINKQGDKNE